jgi:hypothetical protein
MRLSEIHPKKILTPDWYEKYDRQMDLVWHQLVFLNAALHNLKHILSFRFDLFAPEPGARVFWTITQHSLFESAVMTIWRLTVDRSQKGLTLQQLQDQIYQNIPDEKHRNALQRSMRKVRFKITLGDYRHKIREIRNSDIAHFDLQKHLNPHEEDFAKRGLVFSDLDRIRQKLNEFFGVLCFGHDRSVFLIHYSPLVRHPVGSDTRTDIERLLDSVAKESDLLNMPEEHPAAWSERRKQLGDKTLKIINRYRGKFDLEEA